ncbi:hypothetical protein TeGR_g13565 [Tetraparma gracilis]|uniref:Plasma membrane fusion protein PRM1 n=1 Tax=Tetraparma gracilis TaxID=2962635 RepID=A0ABQ6N9T8_9STRA|nr:hypothetical protein TeGR_g13565 [Tetraparma gracilis]
MLTALLLLLPTVASSASPSASFLAPYLREFHQETTPYSFTSEEARSLFPAERNLAYVLDCSDRIDDSVPEIELDENGVPIEEEVSLSGGSAAVSSMKKFRNSSGGWYEEVLRNFMIWNCETKITNAEDDGPKVRCVPEDDAAKGGGGGCIVPSDSTCPVGFCETAANCYWEAPVSGEARVERYTQEEADANEDYLFGQDQDSYAATVVKYLALGIVLAVLNMLIWFIFIIGRCCCCCLWEKCLCRCCSYRPKEAGYNECGQRRIPIFFYFIMVAGIVASAAMTYVGNEDISKALTDTFEHSRGGIQDTQNFLGGAKTPMLAIEGLVDDAADDSIELLQDTDYVEEGLDSITKSLQDFADTYSADPKFPDDVAASMQETTAALDEEVAPVKEDIRAMLDTLQTSLVDGRDMLKESIGDAASQLDGINSTLNGFFDTIDDIEQQSEDYKSLRMAGVLAIFAVALFCCVFGVIGVCSYWTPCTWDDILIHLINITWFLGSGLVTLTWIIAGAVMVLCVVWNDVCQFMDIMVEDFEPYSPAASVGLNACFNNTPLVEAYNLTSRVDFQETIDEKLAELDAVDFDTMFADVKDPVYDVATQIKDISLAVIIDPLNGFTNVVGTTFLEDSGIAPEEAALVRHFCPFNDEYLNADLALFKEPWTIAADQGRTGNTAWETMDGEFQPYARVSTETGKQYMSRVYNIAGVCTGGAVYLTEIAAFPGLVQQYETDLATYIGGGSVGTAPTAPTEPTPGTCVLGVEGSNPSVVTPWTAPNDPDTGFPPVPVPLTDDFNRCSSGDGCEFVCGIPDEPAIEADGQSLNGMTLSGVIDMLYGLTVDTVDLKNNMLLDLGTECVAGAPAPFTPPCEPTQAAKDKGNDMTVIMYIDTYSENLEGTLTSLKDTTENAVGDIMEQVRIFLCNMNCGFVGDVWEEVHTDLCSTMLGGFLQMGLSLWLLALFMFFNAALGAILAVRMRGVSKDEVDADDNDDQVEMKGVNLDIYN